MSNVDTNGKRLNLFRKKPKKVSSNQAFDMMESVADKTNVDFSFAQEKAEKREIESILDAEFEKQDYGEKSAWFPTGKFMGRKVPRGVTGIVDALVLLAAGNVQNVPKALAGKETVTLYRGIPDWFKGKMVKEGKFVSPKATGTWAGNTKESVHGYRGTHTPIGGGKMGPYNPQTGKLRKPATLEFEVPKSWFNKNAKVDFIEGKDIEYWIEGGIPKEFLKKVHKAVLK